MCAVEKGSGQRSCQIAGRRSTTVYVCKEHYIMGISFNVLHKSSMEFLPGLPHYNAGLFITVHAGRYNLTGVLESANLI
jgi:hypothetical protein